MPHDSCRCGHTTCESGHRNPCALCEGEAPKPAKPSPELREKVREKLNDKK